MSHIDNAHVKSASRFATKSRNLTLFKILGLPGRLERIILHCDDKIFAVVQVLDVKCAHEVDQSVRITQEHINYTQS